jgi:hypothetical protein
MLKRHKLSISRAKGFVHEVLLVNWNFLCASSSIPRVWVALKYPWEVQLCFYCLQDSLFRLCSSLLARNRGDLALHLLIFCDLNCTGVYWFGFSFLQRFSSQVSFYHVSSFKARVSRFFPSVFLLFLEFYLYGFLTERRREVMPIKNLSVLSN